MPKMMFRQLMLATFFITIEIINCLLPRTMMFSSIGLHHAVFLNETSLRKVYSGCCLIIDEFIPTLDTENGIYYTHPENLPGAKEDGTSVYFFHKTANAYATGQRKRQKIQNENSSGREHVRWHKIGKTKPVLENGTEKGTKKIMVLYRSAIRGSMSGKSNWVMHQYHLGTAEDEKDGDYVVSN